MKPILKIATLSLAAFFLCSCDKPEKTSANELYVNASLRLNRAASQFEKGHFNDALALCELSHADAERILKEFPSSEIAVQMVSNPSLTMGAVKYADFENKILPKLRRAKENKNGFFCEILGTPALEHLRARITPSFSERQKEQPAAKKRKNIDINEYAKYLKMQRSLIVYEMDAVKNIFEKSKDLQTNPELADLFLETAISANENIKKISVDFRRYEAMAYLAKIYANLGAFEGALRLCNEIENANAKNDATQYLAKCAANSGDINRVKKLLASLPNGPQKDAFLAKLAQECAYTAPEKAFETAMLCQDKAVRDRAFAKIAAISSSEKNFAQLCKKLHIVNPDSLSNDGVFELAQAWGFDRQSSPQAYLEALCHIAECAYLADKALAYNFLGKAYEVVANEKSDNFETFAGIFIDTAFATDSIDSVLPMLKIWADKIQINSDAKNKLLLHLMESKKTPESEIATLARQMDNTPLLAYALKKRGESDETIFEFVHKSIPKFDELN
mgnify:CR=1 FL=1